MAQPTMSSAVGIPQAEKVAEMGGLERKRKKKRRVIVKEKKKKNLV